MHCILSLTAPTPHSPARWTPHQDKCPDLPKPQDSLETNNHPTTGPKQNPATLRYNAVARAFARKAQVDTGMNTKQEGHIHFPNHVSETQQAGVLRKHTLRVYFVSKYKTRAMHWTNVFDRAANTMRVQVCVYMFKDACKPHGKM